MRAWRVYVLSLAVAAAGCGGGITAEDGGPVEDAGGTMDGTTEARCGDGVVQSRRGEACDDGNVEDGDGCSADCTSDESCGNGILDTAAGELCDDGNTDSGDGCRADCESDYRCGNGVLDTVADGASEDEVCDDGNTENGDGCSAACDSDESCGNGVIDTAAGEVCDDGNTEDDDDCSGDCMTSLLCGNGTVDVPEECDDGNVEDGDECSALCLIERCGNGRVDFGEACDDGNTEENDGCRSSCELTCSADADCADADVCNGAETCTDPGTTTSTCAAAASPATDGTVCGTGLICRLGGCVTSACGDGVTDLGAGEECDDGNTDDADGCDNDCTFTCSADADCTDTEVCNGAETCTSPGTTASRCAAGTAPGDGTSCGTGRVCLGGACTTAGCGDGLVTGTEQCDDGNTTNGDGCDSDCTWTCASASDCSDGLVCNGSEVCTSPGTLASRCGAGTPPANGTSCGGSNICVSGACVAARCGDGIVTGTEQCDDSNTTNGDGCDNDCTWTCTSSTDCADTNVCNGAETCTGPSSLASRCVAGTPPATGTACDRDGDPATRDICRTDMCLASTCGDGYTDPGASPAEMCDDGNTASGDGCSSTCQIESATPPTAFRTTSLQLISPRVIIDVGDVVTGGTCQDITQNCARYFVCVADSVNTQIATAIGTMSSGGDYSLHIVDVFRPLVPPSTPSTPIDLYFDAECMESPTPDACNPDPMGAAPISSTANNSTTSACLTPVASEVNGRRGSTTVTYTPTANTASTPCFATTESTITVDVGGILIPLQRARIAATYSGTPATRLINGVVTGFLTERAAADVLLPETLPAPLGGAPLYTLLQAGGATTTNSAGTTVSSACNVGGSGWEDDRDTLPDGTRGFWFFLNFTGDLVTWTEP